MEQRDSIPLKHHSETANPDMTTTQTCHFHETLRLCSEMHHLSCMTYHFYANHNGIAAQTDTRHVHEKSLFGALPNGRAIGAGFEHLRTVADGCEHKNNDRRTQLYPQTPNVKREPFATHSGKAHLLKQMFKFDLKAARNNSTTVLQPRYERREVNVLSCEQVKETHPSLPVTCSS